MDKKQLIIEQQKEQIEDLNKKLEAYEKIIHKLLSQQRIAAWNLQSVEKECAEIYRNTFLLYKDPFGFCDGVGIDEVIMIK